MPAEISAKLPGALGDNRETIVPCPVIGSESVKKPGLNEGLVLLPIVLSTDWVPFADGDGWRDGSDPGGANAAGGPNI